jgi:hypothetical protein
MNYLYNLTAFQTGMRIGEINRAEMRQKMKELKGGNVSAVSLPIENKDGKPTVKIEVSTNGIVFKLSFGDKSSAQIMEQGIKRLLGRHGIMEKK